MTDTKITCDGECNWVADAMKKSHEAEWHLEQARLLYLDIEKVTHHDMPDLEDAQATATHLTDDLKQSIEDYENAKWAAGRL